MHNESIDALYNKIKELQQQINTVVDEVESMRTIQPTEKTVETKDSEPQQDKVSVTQQDEQTTQLQDGVEEELVSIPVVGRKGVFDGIFMTTDDGKKFQVPPNYVSKSMLVVGDMLEIVEVDETGSKYSFKQIKNVERKELEGILTKKDNQWAVHTDEGIFYVVAAAVRFHKADVGDVVAIQLPAGESVIPVEWAAFKEIRKQSLRENYEPRAKQYQNQAKDSQTDTSSQSTPDETPDQDIVKSRLRSPVVQTQQPPAQPQQVVTQTITTVSPAVPVAAAEPVTQEQEVEPVVAQTGEIHVSDDSSDESQSGEIQIQEDDLWELR